MAVATLLLPGDEGSHVSKKTADAAKALKQDVDVVAVSSGITSDGVPKSTDPHPEPLIDSAQKYAAYYASAMLLSGTAKPGKVSTNLADK